MNKKHGFTIVELLIYMGLLGIFLVVMANLFVSTLDVRLETQSQSALHQDSRFILERLTYDLRRAKQIVTPFLGEEAVSLNLLVSENNVDKNFVYSLNNGKLILTVDSEELWLNSKDTQISNLSFLRVGNSDLNPQAKDGVQIKFTLTGTVEKNSGLEVKNFQTTINLR